MGKSPDAFRSIGEVARLVGVAPHVLRYWEGQFTQLSPVKRADGRRYYRPEDVQLAAGLCEVMREEGLTIRGAKRLIAADRGAGLRLRGAARLKDTAGLTIGSDAIADQSAPPGSAVASGPAATIAPAKVPRHKAATPMPLFDDPDTSGNAGVWLHRLNHMAVNLRERSGPLPTAAHAVAQDLRVLLDRR